MNAQTLKHHMDQGDQLRLLDIREGDEFEASETVLGAENMPMGKVFVEAKKGNLEKDQKIIAICKTGGRCDIVARELNAKGYDIEVLEGGLDAWNA